MSVNTSIRYELYEIFVCCINCFFVINLFYKLFFLLLFIKEIDFILEIDSKKIL